MIAVNAEIMVNAKADVNRNIYMNRSTLSAKVLVDTAEELQIQLHYGYQVGSADNVYQYYHNYIR